MVTVTEFLASPTGATLLFGCLVVTPVEISEPYVSSLFSDWAVTLGDAHFTKPHELVSD
jgi:hypothetical protein